MKYVYVFLFPNIHQAQQVLNLSVEPIWTWLELYVVLGLLPLFESQAYVNDTIIKSKWLKWPVTGHRWIPRAKASDAELCSFLWSEP